MFDTGGSSGELTDRFGILPPGDILKCLLALSADEPYARKLLLRRIANPSIPGHTGGNALLLGLEKVFGSLPAAIDALGQLLEIHGRVIPVTLEQSTLCAKYEDGSISRGETSVDLGIHEGKKVREIFLDPCVRASEDALRAIEHADVFCIGPGSFYTSVLPNFLPDCVTGAMRTSRGKVIYISNLFTEGKGMGNMDLLDFVTQVESYVGCPMGWVVTHDGMRKHDDALMAKYMNECKYPIRQGRGVGARHITANLWTDPTIARHDSARLACLVGDIARATAPQNTRIQ
jgi:uncharacterized cofD-like protein